MLHTLWDNRGKSEGRPVVHLLSDTGSDLATFPISVPSTATTIAVGEENWTINGTKTRLEATLPDGKQFSAKPDNKPFGRAKTISIDLAGTTVTAINESRSDWVYVDGNNNKLGQFSGGNNGVRQSITEFEPDAPLNDAEKVFLSWVTRTALEAKTMGVTLVLTLCLLLVIPVAILGLL